MPILQRLQTNGMMPLVSLQGVSLEMPGGVRTQDARGNLIMNRLGMAFRRWCRAQRIETPPSTWSLHLIGRGENDSKNAYPVLDSNVKAAHCKPILFFLSGLATEISTRCGCTWFLYMFTVSLYIMCRPLFKRRTFFGNSFGG